MKEKQSFSSISELMNSKRKKKEEQPNNPMHGVKLIDVLEFLVGRLGWEEMAEETNIKCFRNNPTIKSSLKFLRTTQWARDKVEKLYLNLNK